MLKKYKYRSKTRFPIISFHHNIPLYSSLSFQVLLYFNITTRCTGSNLELQNQHKSTNCETFSSWWTVYIHTSIITISKIGNVDPLFLFIMSFLIGFYNLKKSFKLILIIRVQRKQINCHWRTTLLALKHHHSKNNFSLTQLILIHVLNMFS